jgi:hypothetical protein
MWRTADQIFLIRPETAVGLAAHALALAAINWWPSQGGFEFEYDTGALIFNACRVGKMAVPEPVNASLRRNATEIRKYAAERRAAQ